MVHARTSPRSLSGIARAKSVPADRAVTAWSPAKSVAGPATAPRWAHAKIWLDGAAAHIAERCSGVVPPAAVLEAELRTLIGEARETGFLGKLPRGHRIALAHQIVTWFARRDPAAAHRLTRGSLAMLIAVPTSA